ncbi:MAG: S8 family serine peptidase, partial [Frankiales bacterium]|nr:S8 family serine peptidase [Frankiales bacterium]
MLSSLLIAAALVAAPASASIRAVVSYDGAAVTVDGVQVLRPLPSLRMAVVDADPAALARLASTHGVRGVAPDTALELAGGPSFGEPVEAAEGLGGQAGQAGAGRGVRVAVVDTGVSDTTALDRSSGRLVDAFDVGGAAAPYTDGYGHGTFMASILAGGPVAGSGGHPVGVAPGATVLVVRVAGADGGTSLSQVLAGLDWV